jgi:hypothetical protein
MIRFIGNYPFRPLPPVVEYAPFANAKL